MPPLEERIGYVFRDRRLLQEALTHPSAVSEGRSPGPDNQRLEFLGDAVVQLGVSLLLFRRHPEADEGTLSFLRQELVRRESLTRMAESMKLGAEVIRGESAKDVVRAGEASILADAIEALLGAVCLDGGWEAAFSLLESLLGEIPPPCVGLKGAKSSLQELLQGRFEGEVPCYMVEEAEGVPEEERFIARVLHRGRILGEGRGRSKKRAEEAAAADALGALKG